MRGKDVRSGRGGATPAIAPERGTVPVSATERGAVLASAPERGATPAGAGPDVGRAGDSGRGALAFVKDVDRGTVRDVVECTVAFSALLVASAVLGRAVRLPDVAGFGFDSTSSAGMRTVWFALLATATYFKPQAVLGRAGTVAGVLVTCVAPVAMCAGARLGLGSLFGTGVLLGQLAYAWGLFVFACRLPGLTSLRAAAVVVVCGTVVRQIALLFYSSLHGLGAAVASVAVLTLVAVLIMLRADCVRTLASADQASLDLLELSNPLSSLRPPTLMFVGVFAVAITYHFSGAFGIPGLGVGRITAVLLMFGLLYLLLIQRERQEDRLFSMCVLFMMVGILLTALLAGGDTFVSHTFLYLGYTCFSVLVWLVVYGIGRRNPIAAMPVFCVIECIDAAAQFAGMPLGRLAQSLVGAGVDGTQAVIIGLAIVFFAFVWLGFQRFSFTGAIRGIESIRPLAYAPLGERGRGAEVEGACGEGGSGRGATEGAGGLGTAGGATGGLEGAGGLEGSEASGGPEGEAPEGDPRFMRFKERCQELEQLGGLTPREAEVFELLVRGRNARFIMDTLHVTRNTAKAHIGHIYTKLGVHSHQELLTLMEETAER